MFASQTRDLYHIETDRKGGYIEFAARQIYRAERSEAYRRMNNRICVHKYNACTKRGRRIFYISPSFPIGRQSIKFYQNSL